MYGRNWCFNYIHFHHNSQWTIQPFWPDHARKDSPIMMLCTKGNELSIWVVQWFLFFVIYYLEFKKTPYFLLFLKKSCHSDSPRRYFLKMAKYPNMEKTFQNENPDISQFSWFALNSQNTGVVKNLYLIFSFIFQLCKVKKR